MLAIRRLNLGLYNDHDRAVHLTAGSTYGPDGNDVHIAVNGRREVAELYANMIAAAYDMRDALAIALEAWADQFDGPEDQDLSVSGADLVDWFTTWRTMVAKPALAKAGGAPVDTVTLTAALRACRGAMNAMRAQIDQMSGMFPDDDGTIAAACQDHDDADAMATKALS
jgi:hypothetical protein